MVTFQGTELKTGGQQSNTMITIYPTLALRGHNSGAAALTASTTSSQHISFPTPTWISSFCLFLCENLFADGSALASCEKKRKL